MPVLTTLHHQRSLHVIEYRCEGGDAPPPAPYVEWHAQSSLSFVRRGTFGYRVGSRHYDLTPGAVLLGRAGDEYTHEHARWGGDECLSIQLDDVLLEDVLDRSRGRLWSSSVLPPIPELVVLADAATDEEGALLFVAKLIELLVGTKARSSSNPTPMDRKRAVEAALYIEERCVSSEICLESVAELAGMSVFHFLRMFSKVIGVTPHQYLLRCRLRRAARSLAMTTTPVTSIAYDVGFADLSNFVRTFHRAAGMSPRTFRARFSKSRNAEALTS